MVLMCESPGPRLTVFQLDRYQSGIDHSLIDLESGMVNWYLRIPLSSLILLSSDGAVFSRDPCIGLLQCSGKRKNMAGNGRKQPEKVGYGKKRDGICSGLVVLGYAGVCRRARGHVKVDQAPFPPPGQSGIEYRSIPLFD